MRNKRRLGRAAGGVLALLFSLFFSQFLAWAQSSVGANQGINSISAPAVANSSTWAANVNLTGADTMLLSGGNQKFTLTANETLTIAKGSVSGSATNFGQVQFEICQNATGQYSLAFAAGTGISAINWPNGIQPGYALTAGYGDIYSGLFNGTNLTIKELYYNVPCM